MFKKIDKLYGLDCNKERNDLTIEQERKYIEDCFDTYEKIGFLDFFYSPYNSYNMHNGKKFKVIRRMSETEVDLECLPMWFIFVETGEEIQDYQEEIYKKKKK